MPRASIECRLMVFAKAPLPGQVKTRLVPMLGAEGAASLHRELVEHALAVAVAARLGVVELWCAPDALDPFFAECAARYGVGLRTQGAGDLGEKMRLALDTGHEAGVHGLLIGSDCPAMSPGCLREAGAALSGGDDAVFVPAEDGGYVLVGMARRPDPELFSGIDWGGAGVMQLTRERLRRLGWRWRELGALWDVDRPEDLLRMRQSALP